MRGQHPQGHRVRFLLTISVEKQTFIKFTIHGKGFIQHLIYEVKEGKLGERQDLTDFCLCRPTGRSENWDPKDWCR
jgi:hypothetical protein